ncbi:MAG: penicillin-binding protein activator [Gammaproteobacteria bacterium]|nr:penicillin-binding protein activator [Gammaproteobacteria bacterium]
MSPAACTAQPASAARRPARTALLIVLALGALLGGCTLGPPLQVTPGGERAAAVARRGDHAEAARLYEQAAAGRAGAEQAALQLAAAAEWLAVKRGPEAARVLAAISAPLDAGQTQRRRMLEAEAAYVSGRASDAWQAITAIAEPTTADTARRYLELRRHIALATARPVDAVLAEVAAERFVAGEDRSRLRRTLLAELKGARERGVKLEPRATQDPTVRGWLELGALASRAAASPVTRAAEAVEWRARYPGHPATELLGEALAAPIAPAGATRRVALLLPLTGHAAAAAATLRDGFQTAIMLLSPELRPEVSTYDTGTLTVPEAIDQARAAGADIIIGPLTREEVTLAADVGARGVPLLALNFLGTDRSAPAGMYQFALSPEDEARAVAAHLLATGQRRGVAMAPIGDWGNRVLTAFQQQFIGGGGTLLAQTSYDTATHDYGSSIRTLFGTSASQARRERLQSITGARYEFEPRPRADIEFVFAAGQSTSLRLLRPQLRFYYAGNIGIYSTSDAYSPDAGESNQDLEGIVYPDMPWMLPGDASVAEARALIDAHAGPAGAPRSRLYAFGYDALQLALALRASGGDPTRVNVSGLTGRLTLDPEGRVQRELSWVRIHDGVPTPD